MPCFIFLLEFVCWHQIFYLNFLYLIILLTVLPSAGSEFSEDKFVAKVKMEIVVSKDRVIGAKKCFWNFSSCFTFDWWLKKTAVIHVVYKNFLLGSKKFLQVVHNLVLP